MIWWEGSFHHLFVACATAISLIRQVFQLKPGEVKPEAVGRVQIYVEMPLHLEFEYIQVSDTEFTGTIWRWRVWLIAILLVYTLLIWILRSQG